MIKTDKTSQSAWLIVIVGLSLNLFAGTDSLLSRLGNTLMALAIYQLLSRKVNVWFAVIIALGIMTAYDYSIALLSGAIAF